MSEARVWKCPECGHADEISYDWLAEQGGPVCEHCDCDMELQSDVDTLAADVDRLYDKAEAAGLVPEDFDEPVHDLVGSIAANVNNGGMDGQIRYLIAECGVKAVERTIDEMIESQPRGG